MGTAMIRFRTREPAGEDTAVRVALRDLAREAMGLERMLSHGGLWPHEGRKVYARAVEQAINVGRAQWPDFEVGSKEEHGV
jgi:hypothetical protein